VRRHARARSVVVRLGQTEGEVTLTVSDDGRGFGADVVDGFGLSGMRERVRSAGGTLAVGPGDDGGTTLCARVPVDGQVGPVADGRVGTRPGTDAGAAAGRDDGTQGVAG
jgi:signal transduction histidine kinase